MSPTCPHSTFNCSPPFPAGVLPKPLFCFILTDSGDTSMNYLNCLEKQYHIYMKPEKQMHNQEVLFLLLARFLIVELKSLCSVEGGR